MSEFQPQILRKDGKEAFAVLPWEQYVEFQKRLADAEDLLELRQAKQAQEHEPSVPHDEVKHRLGLE